MADITITIKTDIETEMENAFLDLYANPESLSGLDLCKQQCEKFLLSVLNKYREKQAVETARASVVLETKLSE